MTDNRKSKRRFLKILGTAALTGIVSASRILPASARESIARSVSIRNIHTGEVYEGVYRVGGYYVPEEFEKINHIMRDHRANETMPMDPKLIDIISHIQRDCGCAEPVGLLSGYRTEKTNAMLRRNTSGVAKKSYHILGKAADIRLEGVKTRKLCDKAMKLKAGGVGYYPNSSFVHIDTGKVRHWRS